MFVNILPESVIGFKSNLVGKLKLNRAGFSVNLVTMSIADTATVQFYADFWFGLGFFFFISLFCSLQQFSESCVKLLFKTCFKLFLAVADCYRIVGIKFSVGIFQT